MYRGISTEHVGVSNKSLNVTNIINFHEISTNLNDPVMALREFKILKRLHNQYTMLNIVGNY